VEKLRAFVRDGNGPAGAASLPSPLGQNVRPLKAPGIPGAGFFPNPKEMVCQTLIPERDAATSQRRLVARIVVVRGRQFQQSQKCLFSAAGVA
jgi:hypothetical protein